MDGVAFICCCITILNEYTYLITTSYSFPKLRYRAPAKNCKPLLHCKESIKRNDINSLYL